MNYLKPDLTSTQKKTCISLNRMKFCLFFNNLVCMQGCNLQIFSARPTRTCIKTAESYDVSYWNYNSMKIINAPVYHGHTNVWFDDIHIRKHSLNECDAWLEIDNNNRVQHTKTLSTKFPRNITVLFFCTNPLGMFVHSPSRGTASHSWFLFLEMTRFEWTLSLNFLYWLQILCDKVKLQMFHLHFYVLFLELFRKLSFSWKLQLALQTS